MPRWPGWRASTGSAEPGSRPGREGPLLRLAVHGQVDLLVAEADQPRDARVLRHGRGIAPGDVLDHPVPDPRRPPARMTLVGAARPGLAGQQVDPDVVGREVVAH